MKIPSPILIGCLIAGGAAGAGRTKPQFAGDGNPDLGVATGVDVSVLLNNCPAN